MLPSGTVTFLFTDVEGSTSALERHGAAMDRALARHHELLRASIEGHRGVIFETLGDGVFAAFGSAADAVSAALDLQLSLVAEPWDALPAIQVRAAVHSGDVEVRGDHYFGAPLFRCARLQALAQGGQTLVSGVTSRLVGGALPDRASLRDLGTHRLKDLGEPEHVAQLDHPGLDHDFPPLRSLDSHPHNLPLQLTRFVGRERDLGDVSALLVEHRLVTLTGPGGTGKTRLALQVAADAIEGFDDGVWFVDLGEQTDPASVTPAISGALGVRSRPGQTLESSLLEHLAGRSLILVLDNFEHVLVAAGVVGRMLAAAPGLRVLTTSRVPLHIRGEHEYPVLPLPVPDAASRPTAASLSGYDAVTLFVERALAVDPGFVVTDETARAIAGICARLDGLPLALELAAARLKTLSPDALLARLGTRLPLLTGGSRDVPDRQRTLASTIAWSHDLLDQPRRRVFAALSVFAGGFRLDAAETVCADDGLDVLDAVSQLLDASLLRRTDIGGAEPRFSMLETIREFSAEQLARSGAERNLRRRHVEHFLGLAERLRPALDRPGAPEALRRIEADHDNLRQMLEWTAAEDEDAFLRACAALASFWTLHGHFTDLDRWIERAQPMLAGREDTTAADILHARAAGRTRHGHLDAAGELYREVVRLRHQAGDPMGEGYAWNNIGSIEWALGRDGAAMEAYRTAIAIHDTTPGPIRRGAPMMNLAELMFLHGDITGAADLLDRVIEMEDREGSALPSLTHARRAQLAIAVGDLHRAKVEYGEVLRLGASIRNPLKDSGVSLLAARLAMAEDRTPDARRHVRDAMASLATVDAADFIAGALYIAARLAVLVGRPADAARLVGQATALLEGIRAKADAFLSPMIDDVARAATTVLGEAGYRAAFDAGRRATRDDAESTIRELTED